MARQRAFSAESRLNKRCRLPSTSMSLLASETHAKVAAVQSSLSAVESHLAPLLAKNPKEVARHLGALENAELQVSLAYAAASLYFCHLLSQGVDPSDHPIRQELDRIQLYFKKVRATADEAAEKEASRDRIRVDVDAAKRIVHHFAHAAEASVQRRVEAAASAEARPAASSEEVKPPIKRAVRKKIKGKAPP
ncbi:Nuclear nucleic acid-binding protein C1D [Symbiodinium microadriaticum]|uniref:Nuclear nucleic acid-binding protein C1D n=1 Tax=Symbiodinium microadriaticum TaxID=2951 RepID=A0A1Q9DIQ3_SYMMI|nr:Nuclear nucleic acid-binding protein C1D [Symbiodinium microadriaticum]